MYAVLEVIPVGIGEVQLRGVETGLYVAMNKEGRLYGESAAATDNTVFIENLLGQSLVYLR